MTERDQGRAPASAPPLRVDVLTIFPDIIEGYVSASVIGRARRDGVLDLRVHDLRDDTDDVHRSVDDSPFGGGAGMVLRPEPAFRATERLALPRPLFLLSPGGERFDQGLAKRLLGEHDAFSLLCGRYEGVDQRITEHLVDGEISIGDYVLAGGELAALVVMETVCRLVPGVLGNEASIEDESFSNGLLEYPQYTRPAEFRGHAVPDILRSGDHARIAAWRHAAALSRTIERRPDLIAARGGLAPGEVRLLVEHGYPVPGLESESATPAPSDPSATHPEEPDAL